MQSMKSRTREKKTAERRSNLEKVGGERRRQNTHKAEREEGDQIVAGTITEDLIFNSSLESLALRFTLVHF